MVERAHSPKPFRLEGTKTGFLLFDAMGDSIAALALSTGDHPAEEQLANAQLFRASPDLLEAGTELYLALQGHRLDRRLSAAMEGMRVAIRKAEGYL